MLKTILKYNDHPSIKATEKISKLNKLVEFSNVVKGEILNEIVNQDGLKSFQDTLYQQKSGGHFCRLYSPRN